MKSRFLEYGNEKFFDDESAERAQAAVGDFAIALAKTVNDVWPGLMNKYDLTAQQIGLVVAFGMLHNAPMIIARVTGIGCDRGLEFARMLTAAKAEFFETL